MLRIPHGLDARLTDGSEVASLKHRPRSTTETLMLHISVRVAMVRLEGLGTVKENHTASSGFGPGTFWPVS